jgi:hypothetical protein
MRAVSIFLIIPLLLFLGCEQKESDIVAKVGHYELRREAISDAPNPEELVRNFVDEALLAMEAEKRGLDQAPEFIAELDKIKVALLAQRLMDAETGNFKPPQAKDIEEYYKSHLSEFTRETLEVEYFYFSGTDLTDMNSIKRGLRGGQAPEIVTEEFPQTEFKSGLVCNSASLSEPLNSLASNVVGSILGPVEINDRYYVFKITARYEPGSKYTLNQCREKILDRMMEEAHQDLRERLIKKLHDKYQPSINIEELK